MQSMYPKKGRVILHVDMNSFYASVEAAHDVSLRGKPLAIAGNPEERRGIIVTSSYEARAKGVTTTMPIWEAKRLCPELIIKKPNFKRYRESSLLMFQILSEYTTLVQPVSIDEGYLDITESYELGTPIEIARKIQDQIQTELNLPCSIGIAPNKFLAKMASDMKKPMGITILRKRDVEIKLWPLKVEEMHGVGKKTAEKLNKINVFTIKDLARADVLHLKQLLGINGERLKNKANGEDKSIVDPDAISEFKSIGNSTTLPFDTTDLVEIRKTIKKLSESVSKRLMNQSVVAWNIQLTIRYFDRKTVTRSKKQYHAMRLEEEIFEAAVALFEENWNGDSVRLLGVTAHDLEEKAASTRQLDIFTYEVDAKEEPLYEAMEKLNAKYGEEFIQKGVKYKRKKDESSQDKGTSFQKDFLRNFKVDK